MKIMTKKYEKKKGDKSLAVRGTKYKSKTMKCEMKTIK